MSKLQARNEMVINASAQKIWAVITDINLMHKITPGVVKAKGRMDKAGIFKRLNHAPAKRWRIQRKLQQSQSY